MMLRVKLTQNIIYNITHESIMYCYDAKDEMQDEVYEITYKKHIN